MPPSAIDEPAWQSSISDVSTEAQSEALNPGNSRKKARVGLLRKTFWLAFYCVIYFCLAKFGQTFISLQPSNITLLWLPSGVAFALCLHFGWSAWIWLHMVSLAANFTGMGGADSVANFLHANVSAAVDASAGLLAAIMYRRLMPKGLNSVSDFLPFVVGVALFAGVFTSILLTANLILGGYIPREEMVEFFTIIVLADTLGIILVGPLYLKWDQFSATSKAELKVFLPIAVLIIGTLILFYIEFASGALYTILPLLLLMGFYINIFLLCLTSLVSLVTIIVISSQGIGFFASMPGDSAYEHMMVFLMATALTTLGLGIQNQQLIVSQKREKVFENEANTDPLTGLLNRRSFVRSFEEALKTWKIQGQGSGFSVAILDLDFFKKVNDTYGHPAGDAVLKHFANFLMKQSRKDDLTARYGGEEFIVFMAHCDAEEARAKMDRVRHLLEADTVRDGDHKIKVTVSIGVAAVSEKDTTIDDILQRADKALYTAKGAGRNQVAVST